MKNTLNTKTKRTLKKFGVLGFMFFLIKGLVWLAIFAGLGSYFT